MKDGEWGEDKDRYQNLYEDVFSFPEQGPRVESKNRIKSKNTEVHYLLLGNGLHKSRILQFFSDDVQTSDQFAVQIELRVRGPVAKLLEALNGEVH